MKTKRIAHLVLSAALIAIAGCNSSNNVPSLTDGSASTDSLPAYTPASATGRVFGSIKFEGTPPVMEALKTGGSRFCVQNARGLTKQDVLVTKDGNLRNVIVYVKSGFEGKTYTPPNEPVVLDQQKCVYVPHVLTIMAKQKLKVLNSDPTFHNVHSMPQVNTPFNFAQTDKGAETTVSFEKAEMPIRIGCDLHRWMSVWVGVFDHPFHSTSGDEGNYELKLPPGKYEIAAWHETLGEKVLPVEIGDKTPLQLDFTFGK